VRIATVAERPDLVDPGRRKTRDTPPEYDNHSDVLSVCWGRLDEERAEFQFLVLGEDDRILARA
jgi:hypothetical protein